MAVLSTDIKYYGSGANNIGGAILTSAEIVSGGLHALFDAVSAAESLDGMTDYRCIYVRIESIDSTLIDASTYVDVPPLAVGSSIQLGVGTSAINGVESTIPTENSVPPGVTFLNYDTAETAALLGDLGPNDFKALWIKRVIAVGTSSAANDQFTLTTVGETV